MRKTILLIIALSFILAGCKNAPSGQYTYQHPEQLNDGLEAGSLDEVHIDPTLIDNAVNSIREGQNKEVHAMLLYKDGKLVLEEYFTGHDYQWDAPNHHGPLVGWDRTKLHCLHSVTKSFTATCIGLAIEEGFIDSVRQSIFDYLPEHQHLKTDGKDKITIEHLLTMTSGLEWDEWSTPYSSTDNDNVGIWFQDKDPITYILEKPLVAEPGTSFAYSGGNMDLLGEIIRQASGMPIDAFASRYLFQPLGIDTAHWDLRFENGVIETGGSLKLRPRDMAKEGVLFLNKGVWNGKRILSEEWAEKSATPFAGNQGIDIPNEDSGRVGYGYAWWTKPYTLTGQRINMYYAGGWGGQHIMVLPQANTVVVFTGGNYMTYRPPFRIMQEYILPAIVNEHT